MKFAVVFVIVVCPEWGSRWHWRGGGGVSTSLQTENVKTVNLSLSYSCYCPLHFVWYSHRLRVQSTSPTHYVARNVRCNFFFNPLNTLAVYRNSATARLLVTVVYMYTMACT